MHGAVRSGLSRSFKLQHHIDSVRPLDVLSWWPRSTEPSARARSRSFMRREYVCAGLKAGFFYLGLKGWAAQFWVNVCSRKSLGSPTSSDLRAGPVVIELSIDHRHEGRTTWLK